MPQESNPYASPLTAHGPSEPSRYRNGSFAFVLLDLGLSFMFTVPLLVVFFIRGYPVWQDWAMASAFFFLPSTLGIAAFTGLIFHQKWALAVARVVGVYGVAT